MNEDDKKTDRVKARVRRIRSFYTNVLTFIAVNVLLLIINLITSPGSLWFYWVTIIWGVVLLIQAFNTFTIKDRFLGDEWEEKKVKKILEKDEKHNKPK